MTDFNRVMIHGRIAKNCESTRSDSGLKIVRFLLISNKTRRKVDGSYEEDSSLFPLAVFGSYAEMLEPRLNKGQGVLVEGRIWQDRWEKDGQKYSEMTIRVDHLYFDAAPKRDNSINPSENNNKYKLEQGNAEDSELEELYEPSELEFPPADWETEETGIF